MTTSARFANVALMVVFGTFIVIALCFSQVTLVSQDYYPALCGAIGCSVVAALSAAGVIVRSQAVGAKLASAAMVLLCAIIIVDALARLTAR